MFLIFHDFQFSCHIPCPTLSFLNFPPFSVFLAIFHVLTFLNFPPFSVFLAIFHVLKCVFLTIRDFQFSRHIPGPSVCIFHFSRFLVISSFFNSQVDVSHFPCFQFSCHIPRPTVDISKFSIFFSIPRHISRPKMYFSFSVIFSFLAIWSLQCAFLISHVF
ncbi:Uncharacterised protein [Chlamydia abortus]|nr:Uncharacterised protein [Chlamydia abortus]